MASLFSSLHSLRFSSSSSSSSSLPSPSPSPASSSPSLAFCTFPCLPRISPLKARSIKNRRLCVAKAVEDETQQPPQQQEEKVITDSEQQQQQTSSTAEQQPVVVPISASDTLTMFFQAEGILNETVVPTLTKALEETEGVTNLKVQLYEGLATLELEKQTTIQATGVASSLVEAIQGLGFKLQTLNLSFDGEEVAVA